MTTTNWRDNYADAPEGRKEETEILYGNPQCAVCGRIYNVVVGRQCGCPAVKPDGIVCGPQPILNGYGGPKVVLLSITDQETLADAMLKAHEFRRSSCYECPNLVQADGFKCCVGGQYECCQCAACKIARKIISPVAQSVEPGVGGSNPPRGEPNQATEMQYEHHN